LVSFYLPSINEEQYLLSFLICCMFINTFMFFICHACFILTLKYDVVYVNIILKIIPDIEYFVDFEKMDEI